MSNFEEKPRDAEKKSAENSISKGVDLTNFRGNLAPLALATLASSVLKVLPTALPFSFVLHKCSSFHSVYKHVHVPAFCNSSEEDTLSNAVLCDNLRIEGG